MPARSLLPPSVSPSPTSAVIQSIPSSQSEASAVHAVCFPLVESVNSGWHFRQISVQVVRRAIQESAPAEDSSLEHRKSRENILVVSFVASAGL